MIERGVNVAIGMDNWGASSDDDILEELRLAGMLHRLPSRQRFESCPHLFDLLRMLTVNGVRAVTFTHGLGRLLPGSPADAVILDFDQMTEPYLDDSVHPVEAFVHMARTRHIDTVIAEGEPLFHEGGFTRVDGAAVGREVAASAAASSDPTFQAFSRTLRELRPHLERHYAGGSADRAAEPFYVVNERWEPLDPLVRTPLHRRRGMR